jgi:hypothetical protein
LNFVFFSGQERSVLLEKTKLRQKPSLDRKDFPGGSEVESGVHETVDSDPFTRSDANIEGERLNRNLRGKEAFGAEVTA